MKRNWVLIITLLAIALITTCSNPFWPEKNNRGIGGEESRVGSLTLNKTSLKLIAGETETLVATVQPAEKSQNVNWSSGKIAVATIADDGVVTAVASGVTTITVTANDGGYTAQCTVFVYPENMVRINAGVFTMGQTGVATPAHEVTLTAGFYIGKYQITQEQYEAVMGINPSYFTIANGRSPDGVETDGRRPVEYVTWYDAIEFCNKLSEAEGLQPVYNISGRTPAYNPENISGSYPITSATVTVIDWDRSGYRLPTEAQWEYACRAGTTTSWYTGDTEAGTGEGEIPLADAAWYYGAHSGNANSKTHEVGLKTPNAWGLYDMHGNMWEWCWDWYGSYTSDAQTNPVGASSGTYRVWRGGYWNNSASFLRSAYRSYNNPSSGFGFRVSRP